ncbi:Uncharacterised protein [Candidatus Bilamarchaeum dharawalense]|uniref:Uncharacterized protein n=1 Tax=Candidatus Bilamarchaeum dharawalense TaxID=2885759 RepID=A0A5E4LQV2_9ARCH|nr:Uncharacterised protein [Candidatus Bilamarchaeum dharawalense]
MKLYIPSRRHIFMRWLLALVLLTTMVSAEFLIEKVDVTISDIQSDGSAKVHESIKFIIYGDYASSLYDSGMTSDQLSYWSSNLGLKDIKFHVNPSLVDIRDLRVRPQPRTQCNPIQKTCHGEIILDYQAYPSINSTINSGLFSVEQYKPRTRRYTINPGALSFTTTPEGNIILDKDIYLILKLPQDSLVLDANPQPTNAAIALPSHVESLSWTDSVLVKFSLIFDVEESIDQEVSDFFGGIIRGIIETLKSPHGVALVILIVVLMGSYAYIVMSKRRDEE